MLAEGVVHAHFEADMYFTSPTGRYDYDNTKVNLAHKEIIASMRAKFKDIPKKTHYKEIA